jgi:N-glycosylase/DNA lyase
MQFTKTVIFTVKLLTYRLYHFLGTYLWTADYLFSFILAEL